MEITFDVMATVVLHGHAPLAVGGVERASASGRLHLDPGLRLREPAEDQQQPQLALLRERHPRTYEPGGATRAFGTSSSGCRGRSHQLARTDVALPHHGITQDDAIDERVDLGDVEEGVLHRCDRDAAVLAELPRALVRHDPPHPDAWRAPRYEHVRVLADRHRQPANVSRADTADRAVLTDHQESGTRADCGRQHHAGLEIDATQRPLVPRAAEVPPVQTGRLTLSARERLRRIEGHEPS
ncbi:hypothetical protein [Pseudactinotalea suaedae]